MNGRRAELPPAVADWMVAPYAVRDGLSAFDPFAGPVPCSMRLIGRACTGLGSKFRRRKCASPRFP
jgi:hypothetical protein